MHTKYRKMKISSVLIFILTASFLEGCQQTKSTEKEKAVPVTDCTDEWSDTLQREGILNEDINGDGQKDSIKIDYVELEGSQYIQTFEISISGKNNTFKIEGPYPASFVKMEQYDFDKDQTDEMIFLFDTHGGGGEGTHDIYVLWQNADEITVEKIDPYFENLKDVDSSWNIDGIYDIEKVQYGKDEKLLAYQYVWGEGGHSDKVGIMVSEVLFQKEKKIFVAEESWLEEDIKPDVILDSEND